MPTGIPPQLDPLPGIKAVIFDIYGTLLISAAGDTDPDPEIDAAIEAAHATSPYPYSEVDIREIHAALQPGLSPAEIERHAIACEHRSNPTAVMPGATKTLRALAARDFSLGLVSNAQFYTVPILEQHLGAGLGDHGIDPELCRFSYLDRRAKPDPFPFQQVRDRLRQRGIKAREALYIGNDVRNDIAPAIATGFRTALFAGDARSLRLRGFSPESCGADLVLTELGQLVDCL
nr:HAD family hydrolase [Luteolibacter marinus]